MYIKTLSVIVHYCTIYCFLINKPVIIITIITLVALIILFTFSYITGLTSSIFFPEVAPSNVTNVPLMKTLKGRTCVGRMKGLMRRLTFLLTVCRKSLSHQEPSVSRLSSSHRACSSVSQLWNILYYREILILLYVEGYLHA